MSYVKTTIGIGDKDSKLNIDQFSSLSLFQGIHAHHQFRLVCRAEDIVKKPDKILDASKNLVGEKITIQLDEVKITETGSAGVLKFMGVITQVEATRYSGHTGDITIIGFSPSILMDDTPHCRSWEMKDFKCIAGDALEHLLKNKHFQDLSKPRIEPVPAEPPSGKEPYTVQYNETTWQFLNRLSAAYGQWFFLRWATTGVGCTAEDQSRAGVR
jgi:uncharacterized protein involved in type VI secretion and phage assembly